MITYCVKCRKKKESLDSKMFKTKNGRLIMQSNCAVSGIKKSRFVNEQKPKGFLINLGLKTPLSKIPLLGDILLWPYENQWYCEQIFTGKSHEFMPEMHLKQPGFTYSACGPFTKNKEKIEKFMQTGNTGFTYKFDNACSQHDMAHGK